MNTNTGEIRDALKVSVKERASGAWVKLTEAQLKELWPMNRAARRAWARKHGVSMPRLDEIEREATDG